MRSPRTHLDTLHGRLDFPVYLPDATYGVVRAADASDLRGCAVRALVMNTFHLMQKPGSSTISALGGLHKMADWQLPIVTDSGGFQAYSLIRQNPKFGTLTEKGLSFQPEGAERKFLLTPEKSIQLQFSYGADILVCLDDCTHVDSSLEEQKISVRRTVDWARRSKQEFERLLKQKKLSEQARPRLFGVVQGGGYPELRKECADKLLEIGFDGYGFGGWPLDADNHLLTDILGLTRELIPEEYPMHALGVGHPENVAACFRLGYDMYDSAMPTRDARHGRLYTLPKADASLTGKWLKFVYIEDERHIKADLPVSPGCDCPVCAHYSVGYLRHLFKMNETLYTRLATLHNLRFMTRLTERLQAEG
jgi:queuine tRNA-ribosyltransferase